MTGRDDARRRRGEDRHRDPYADRRRRDEQERQQREREEPPGPDDWAVPAEDGRSLRRVARPEEVGDLLPGLVRERGWGDRLEASTVTARWAEIVGPDLAQRCRPVRVAGRTLVVEAVDRTWATQLRYMTTQIVARTNAVVGRELVKEARITVGASDA